MKIMNRRRFIHGTGMGLAMMANAKGYSLSTPLSKAIPAEKRAMLRFFGSNVEELDDTL